MEIVREETRGLYKTGKRPITEEGEPDSGAPVLGKESRRRKGKFILKKLISAVLSAALIVLAFPAADHAASSGDSIIDMHGTRTYIGLSSDWSKSWSEKNFEDVTNEDVTCSGSLTVKAGTVGDVSVDGAGSKMTVKGGTVKNIRSSGSVEISGGTVYSVQAEGDVKLNKASVRRNVRTGGEFAASGSVSVGGPLEGEDITVGSGVTLNVADKIICLNNFTLSGGTVKADEVDGQDTAKTEIKKYSGTLPILSRMSSVQVDTGNSVTGNGKFTAGRLAIAQKSEFIAPSSIELDTLEGPGTLSIRSGKLLIHDGVTSEPLLIFSDVVSKGTLAFKADEDAVDEDDIQIYDYSLEKKTSGSIDEFRLTTDLSEGITMDHSSVSVDQNHPATVKAQVKPSLSRFAQGTKITWELHGDTSAFSYQADAASQSCKVSWNSGASAKSRATLVAYLVDSRGDKLTSYKSDSCVVSVGGTGLSCDTSGTYTFGANSVYYYKVTTTDAAAPNAVSSNPSAVSVAFSKQLPDGYLYQLTNVGTGTAVITTTSSYGPSASFNAVGTGSGIVSDTPFQFSMKAGSTYQFKFTVNGSGSYSFASGNSGVFKTVSLTRSGNAYYYKVRAGKTGGAGLYGAQTGKPGVRQCVVNVY